MEKVLAAQDYMPRNMHSFIQSSHKTFLESRKEKQTVTSWHP